MQFPQNGKLKPSPNFKLEVKGDINSRGVDVNKRTVTTHSYS